MYAVYIYMDSPYTDYVHSKFFCLQKKPFSDYYANAKLQVNVSEVILKIYC